jgi:hypothetical protein
VAFNWLFNKSCGAQAPSPVAFGFGVAESL